MDVLSHDKEDRAFKKSQNFHLLLEFYHLSSQEPNL